MSLIKKFKILFIVIFSLTNSAYSEELKKVGKFKDWEVIKFNNNSEIICYAQTKPVLQSPKSKQREARLFVSFRPKDKISDEISITSGYEFNNQNSVLATSGTVSYTHLTLPTIYSV